MTITYRPDIDGLRAFAVLAVLGFHAFPGIFPGGFIGVDVFFVISGYLITSILAVEIECGRWSILRFYARRILRIFPALLLVLVSCFFIGWHVLLAGEYKSLGKHIAAGATFVSNFALWFESGYFDKASEAKPLLHLWSLAIEEQFYVVWPLLIWILWRVRRSFFGIVVGLFLLSLLLSTVLVFDDRTQAFYSPLSRAWELLAGALVALKVRAAKGVPAWVQSGRLQWFAALLLLACVFLFNSHYPFPGALALLPVASAAVLMAAATGVSGPGAVLSSNWLVSIGLISYPLYLWHWPLLSFAFIVESGQPSAALRMCLLLASGLLAFLTYRLVEKPLRGLPRRWVVGGLLLGMVVVGLLGKNVFDRDGLERIRHKNLIHVGDKSNQDFIDFEKTGLITAQKCDQPFKFPERDVCLVMHAGKKVTAAVIGDSHAVHAFWGLAQFFDRAGENLKVFGKGACVPFLNYASPGGASHCQPHIDQTLQSIAKSPDIRRVALVFRGRYLPAVATSVEVAKFEAGLDATLALLTKSSKDVYYFLPVIEPGFDPRLCAGTLPLGRKPPHPCVISQEADSAKSLSLRSAVAAVLLRHPKVLVVEPNGAFCSEGVCPIIQGGHSVFKDDNHLSHFGSLLLEEALSSATASHRAAHTGRYPSTDK